MDKEKDTKKLNAEELEKRVAPLVFTVPPEGSSDPTTSTPERHGQPPLPGQSPSPIQPGGGVNTPGGKQYIP